MRDYAECVVVYDPILYICLVNARIYWEEILAQLKNLVVGTD